MSLQSLIQMLPFLILNNRLEAAAKFYETSNRNYREELITNFHKGKRSDFLKLFLLLRREEKLQFYLRVYFLIFHIHPALKGKGTIPEDEVTAFKEYLDTKGADLAKTNEFLEFYALPFVKKPLEHASFKSLFKKEWINNLTEKLHIFLQDEDRRMKEEVKLLGREGKEGKDSKEESDKRFRSPEFNQIETVNMRQLEEKNMRLFEEVEQFKAKYASLELRHQNLLETFKIKAMESHNKWFQFIRELTNNSRTLIDLILKAGAGFAKDRKFQRIKKRTENYEKMVKKELDELMDQSQDLSIFDKPSVNQISYSVSVTPNLSQRNISVWPGLEEFLPTNFVALLKDFRKMEDQQKIQVILGFSWRIIRSRNKWVRRQTIVGLVVNDFLGLMNGDVQALLFNRHLLPHVLRLFLFISEDSYGSRVLFRNGGLYKQVVDLIPQVHNDGDYACLGLLLEILQNIWHSREILLQLINLNVVELCANVLLEDRNILQSDDILESIVTLLLNVTALKEGLDAYEQQINIFYSLSQAFKETSDSNRNLIGAIIYALVGRRVLWKLAHEAKLPQFIDDLIRIDARSNKQQLKLIQQKLQTFQPGKTIDSDYDEQDSLDSNLQEEIFERNEEQLTNLDQYINGHDLLINKYPLKGKEADKQLEEINKIMSQFERSTQPIAEAIKTPPQGLTQIAKQKRVFSRENRELKEHKQVKQPLKEPKQPLKQPKQPKQAKEQVRLPDIKSRKESKADNAHQRSQGRIKTTEAQEYYSYKSPNFKQNDEKNEKNAFSVQVDVSREGTSDKQRINSFDLQREQQRQDKISKIQGRLYEKGGEAEKKIDKRSAEKPDYRIKKSSSVEKGIGSSLKKQEMNYQTNKNASNVPEYNASELKSPPPKRTREEVLRQLNQELRAEKKAEVQERKISSKNIQNVQDMPLPVPPQRENSHLKKNNFVGPVEELKDAFSSKPKIRRTPPREEK